MQTALNYGYKLLLRLYGGKKPFRRHSYRCEDNIKWILRKYGCEDVDWIKLAQDRVQ
jgi:hypothetical protein